MRCVVAIALFAFPVLSGCNNSCQRVCDRMANFARSCDYQVTDDAVRCCKEGQSGANSQGDRAVCRQFGGLSDIEDNWTCDDLADYEPFDGSACN